MWIGSVVNRTSLLFIYKVLLHSFIIIQFIHSFIHSVSQSAIHSVTYSFLHSIVYPFVQLLNSCSHGPCSARDIKSPVYIHSFIQCVILHLPEKISQGCYVHQSQNDLLSGALFHVNIKINSTFIAFHALLSNASASYSETSQLHV